MNTWTASGRRLAHLARALDVDLEHDARERAGSSSERSVP